MTTSEKYKQKIGFMGASKNVVELLELFSNNKEIEVLFVVDSDPAAPGMTVAKKLGIKALTKPEVALKNFKVDMIIECTGSQEIIAIAADAIGVNNVVGIDLIALINKIFKEQRSSSNHQVFADLASVRQEIDRNTRDVSKTLHGIEKISNELEVLAINAGIQASRAGEFGKGFAVVAGEVKSTARVARDLAGDIDRVISEISSMSKKIDQSLKKVL